MSGFQIELVSPAARVLSTAAYAVAVPSVEGELTAMVGHAPLVCALDAGLVRIYATSLNDKPQNYFVAGGFCDVSETGCTILAEQAVPQADLKLEKIEAELVDLSARLEGTTEAATKADLQAKLALAQAKRRFAA